MTYPLGGTDPATRESSPNNRESSSVGTRAQRSRWFTRMVHDRLATNRWRIVIHDISYTRSAKNLVGYTRVLQSCSEKYYPTPGDRCARFPSTSAKTIRRILTYYLHNIHRCARDSSAAHVYTRKLTSDFYVTRQLFRSEYGHRGYEQPYRVYNIRTYSIHARCKPFVRNRGSFFFVQRAALQDVCIIVSVLVRNDSNNCSNDY